MNLTVIFDVPSGSEADFRIAKYNSQGNSFTTVNAQESEGQLTLFLNEGATLCVFNYEGELNDNTVLIITIISASSAGVLVVAVVMVRAKKKKAKKQKEFLDNLQNDTLGS
jgi:hypothetical protein